MNAASFTGVALLLAAATTAHAQQAATAPANDHARFIRDTLREVTLEKDDPYPAASKLASRGSAISSALAQALASPDQLAAAGEIPGAGPNDPRVELLTQLRMRALKMAATQITLGFDPIAAIARWAAARDDDRPGGRTLPARVVRLEIPVLQQVLPGYLFYQMIVPGPRVEYGQGVWPSQNIFVVDEKARVWRIARPLTLQRFFGRAMMPVRDMASARLTAAAWAVLASVLANDGYYRFSNPVDDAAAIVMPGGGYQASARTAAVAQSEGGGDSGFLEATLTFDGAGHLTGVTQKNRLVPGERPEGVASPTTRPAGKGQPNSKSADHR
ncbi:MAG: hypothetical protein ABFD92_03445 [Planctomycetaceae bacterium]|nr:hypothetical protein [Planctomycetaceae bacterium]